MTRHSRSHWQAEPSSWWPFVSMALGALGSYALLVVHLVLDAAGGSPWLWTLMTIPGVIFLAAGLTVAIGSGISIRERLATIPAALLGYSPRAPVRTPEPQSAGRRQRPPVAPQRAP
jgi:hypothetical protein